MEKQTVEGRLASAGMYVRAHLDERLTLEGIAAVAGFSPFHFHRLFRVAFGENLSAFVARHRLQRAASELRTSARSITEIGLRCGYESPSAFGRAFLRAFDMTPSAYRAADKDAVPIPPVLTPLLDGDVGPRIEFYSAREALALRHVGPYDALDPVFTRLYGIAVRRNFLPSAKIIGLSYDSPDLEEHDTLRFDACITITPGADVAGARRDGLHPIAILGGKHAVFRRRGPYQRITHTYDLLVATWILSGRIELRDGPFVNTYLSNPNDVAASALECDLAFPIA